MVGIIIIISSISLILLLYKLMKPGVIRYIVPVFLSVLYAFLLFYIGFSINAYLFYILAALLLIVLIFLIIKGTCKKTG